MTKQLAFIIATSALLASCAAIVPVEDLAALPQEKQQAIKKVVLWNPAQLAKEKFTVVGLVEGHSCQSLLSMDPATNSAAVEQLKLRAVNLGAGGITNIQCREKGNAAMTTYCNAVISCTAEAIKVL